MGKSLIADGGHKGRPARESYIGRASGAYSPLLVFGPDGVTMQLKKDQLVRIKKQGVIYGRIVRPRTADEKEPDEKRHYLVRISDERWYTRTNLEPIFESNQDAKLDYGTLEWIDELERFIELLNRWKSGEDDERLVVEIGSSAAKLGILIPVR